jgi:hypothetical protein
MAEVYTYDSIPLFCLGNWPVLLVNSLTVLYLTFSSEKAVRVLYPSAL